MAHRGTKVPDSDDEFSGGTFPQEIPKKSKLSRKKNKNKENATKPHTSTQMEVPETLITRGGRPARKTAEELQFQKELEEALKLSSEEVSSSSAEIVNVNSKNESGDYKEKAPTSGKVTGKDFDEILVVTDSQESVEAAKETKAAIEDPEKEEKGRIEDSEDENIVVTKKKCRIIDSEDEFEAEVINNETEKRLPELPQAVPNFPKNSASSKKRKVDESWVVTDNGKKSNNKGLRTTLKRTPKPIKKYTGVSSDEDSPVEDNDGSDESSGMEELLPVKAKMKTPAKKNKKTSDNKKLPTPLKSLNPNSIESPSIPLPKSKNMFQNKSPIRHVVNPRSLAQKSLTPGPPSTLIKHALPAKSFTPGPTGSTHSITALLKQFQNQTKSSPLVGVHAKTTTPTPTTPLQRKIPGWNPPSKIGNAGTGNSTPGPSPSIGLRVGLSRNFKAKPLHSGVKYP